MRKRDKLRSLIIDISVFATIFVLVQLAATLVVANFVEGVFNPDNSLTDFGFLVTYLCAMVPILILVTRYESLRYGYSIPIKSAWRGFDPTTVLFGFVLLIATTVTISPLLEMLPHSERNIPLGGWAVVATCIAAPIFEEIIFRGRLFSMLNRTTSALTSALISALLFGAVHGDIGVMIEGFMAGVIFSYAYIHTGSIISPILIHMCNNAIAYALITLSYQDRSMLEIIGESVDMTTVYVVSLVITIVGLVYVIRGIRGYNRPTIVNEESAE